MKIYEKELQKNIENSWNNLLISNYNSIFSFHFRKFLKWME